MKFISFCIMILLFSGLESFSRLATHKVHYGFTVDKRIKLKARDLNGLLWSWVFTYPEYKKVNTKSISL